MALLAELADILCSVSLGEIGTLLETRTGYGTLLNWCIIWVSSPHPKGEKVAEGQLKRGSAQLPDKNHRRAWTLGGTRVGQPLRDAVAGTVSGWKCW